jgi:AraC-like DNA-binding protein
VRSAPVPSWDIAVPARPGRVGGVSMAGFSDRTNTIVDVELVPHPAVMLVVNLGDEPFLVEEAGGRQHRGSIVAGLAPSGARGRGLTGSFACLQVRLSPAVAHAVLDGSAELGGAMTALDDLWGRDAARFEERLRAAGSWAERFAIAEAAVLHRLDGGRALDPEVAFCWGRMVAGRGRTTVERLAAEVGWSRKRLWSRFRSQVGLTPKRTAQLIRFDEAAHRLAAGRSAAVVAAETGYVDQSHLHRDVVAFTGATPAAVATAPFLAVDPIAWPGHPPALRARTGRSAGPPSRRVGACAPG